ncbi:hypothetical protein D1BOALGB6SA_1118 [Olavius sp. associated proteobacterium Delta 1]|nr:hypothetical protein D1BOALGB6SA_1118 [Olavius sp. associated proteobacterium Delta 1]
MNGEALAASGGICGLSGEAEFISHHAYGHLGFNFDSPSPVVKSIEN